MWRIEMTLIISVATADKVVQVSDRRQTTIELPSGRVIDYDDTVNKAVAVYCKDARFAVACAGLGALLSQRTDDWVVDCLGSVVFAERDLRRAEQALKGQAERDIKVMSIPQGQIRATGLTFALAGFSKTGGAFITSVTNVEGPNGRQLDSPKSTFSSWPHYVRGNPRTVSVKIDGAKKAVDKKVRAKLDQLKNDLFLREDMDTISHELVKLIRQCAADPKYGHGIGRNCMSVALLAEAGNEFVAYYHTEGSEPRRYGPSLVTEDMLFKDFYEEGTGGNIHVHLGPEGKGLTTLHPGQKSGKPSNQPPSPSQP
jgi:hypothetical protein